MLFLSCYLTDEAKLDRLIPYVVDLLYDDAAVVRAAAVRTILQVLSLVSAITPANASVIPEYILVNTKHLSTDPDTMVRCMYAQCIVPLTDTSALYLEMSQALKAHSARRIYGTGEEQGEVSRPIFFPVYSANIPHSHMMLHLLIYRPQFKSSWSCF